MTGVSTAWVKPPISGLSESSSRGRGSEVWFWLPWSNFTLAEGQLFLLLRLFCSCSTRLAEEPHAAHGRASPGEEGEAEARADTLFIFNCMCRGRGATHHLNFLLTANPAKHLPLRSTLLPLCVNCNMADDAKFICTPWHSSMDPALRSLGGSSAPLLGQEWF